MGYCWNIWEQAAQPAVWSLHHVVPPRASLQFRLGRCYIYCIIEQGIAARNKMLMRTGKVRRIFTWGVGLQTEGEAGLDVVRIGSDILRHGPDYNLRWRMLQCIKKTKLTPQKKVKPYYFIFMYYVIDFCLWFEKLLEETASLSSSTKVISTGTMCLGYENTPQTERQADTQADG